MKFQSHIPKPPLLSRLKLLSVGLFTALTCLLINPITAHADHVQVIADAVVAQYNGTSDSNHGGTSHIVNGVAYTRTGYLCVVRQIKRGCFRQIKTVRQEASGKHPVTLLSVYLAHWKKQQTTHAY